MTTELARRVQTLPDHHEHVTESVLEVVVGEVPVDGFVEQHTGCLPPLSGQLRGVCGADAGDPPVAPTPGSGRS